MRWISLALLALFTACGSDDDTLGAGAAGSGGKSAGAGIENGAAGEARAGSGGRNAEGGDAGPEGSDAGSGGSSEAGEGAAAGSGTSPEAGRGGSGPSASGGTDSGSGGAGGDDPVGLPAASVSIVEHDFGLAVGSTVTLGAEARDAQGNVVAAELSWRSSDASIASVSGGRVTGVALGRVEITVSADGVTSAPLVIWVNPLQTTGSALREAVTAGTLSEDQALVYRVFSLFRDGRLPGEYWSTFPGDRHGDHQLMFEVAQRFGELSTTHQEAVAPYLVPPIYAPSRSAGTSSALTLGIPPAILRAGRLGFCSGLINPGWESQDTDNFRVWYSPEVFETEWAMLVGTHAEAAYQALVTAGGFRPPVPDSGLCNGGDERIDIYLPNEPIGAMGVTTPIDNPATGGISSAYIQISPTVDVSELRGTVAHEFMHVLQAAYANLYTPSYVWTLDGTATWAESVLDPGSSSYVGYADDFLTRIHQPLFFPNHYCNSALAGAECPRREPEQDKGTADLKIYGSYLFFQFIEHKVGAGTIRNFFAAAEAGASDTESLHELSYVLSGHGGLTGIWAEFARTLWNRDPIPEASSFRGWDGQSASLAARNGADEIQDLAPAQALDRVPRVPSILSDGVRAADLPLNELSATYDHYRFGPGVRSVTFYNGFSQKLGKTPFGVTSESGKVLDTAGEAFIVYDTTEEQLKGREVWALKKIAGRWTSENWTRTPFGIHCLDKASERLEELVLIFSNGNYTTARGTRRGDDFTTNAIGPLGTERAAVVASPVPCWKYKGDTLASLTYQDARDSFEVSLALAATFVGKPQVVRHANAIGLGDVLLGWHFALDPSDAHLTVGFEGMLGSCGERSRNATFLEYSGSQVDVGYGFASLLNIPDGRSNWYLGRAIGFQWIVYAEHCLGVEKRLPAPAQFDFDLKFEYLQSIEPRGQHDARLSGMDVLGPVVNDGDYSNVPDVKNSWCFAGLREGEPASTLCN